MATKLCCSVSCVGLIRDALRVFSMLFENSVHHFLHSLQHLFWAQQGCRSNSAPFASVGGNSHAPCSENHI